MLQGRIDLVDRPVAESTEMSVYALKALVNHSLGGDVTTGYVQHSTERLRVPARRVAD